MLAVGLSPRTRGNPRMKAAPLPAGGSIPAHAGEPVQGRLTGLGRRVYPRARGGTSIRSCRISWMMGLSPRTRGNPRSRAVGQDSNGSIPAHAGEPFRHQVATSHKMVYPRARGGTISPEIHTPSAWGLSPRTRGNLCGGPDEFDKNGSIPAHAGEPLPLLLKSLSNVT